MGRNVTIAITCDRCGCDMAEEYRAVLINDIPAWERTDEYLLCEDCWESFKRWMKSAPCDETDGIEEIEI